MFCGGLFAGWFLDKVGRRLSLAFACAVSMGGIAAQYKARHPVTFLLGKMITGFTQGTSHAREGTNTMQRKSVRIRLGRLY
jgi:MFS family permease